MSGRVLGTRSRREAWLVARLLVLVLAVGGSVWRPATAQAQPSEPWSDPQMLSVGLLDESGQPLRSVCPVLVADPWGGVHAFWTMLPRQQAAGQDGILFYSQWDGSTWSPPIDILYARHLPMWLPRAALDEAGRVHVAWQVGVQGPVWYSSSMVGQAGSAKAWSASLEVSDLASTGFGLAADSLGQAHIVFCTGEEEDRCYYSFSSDGYEWTSGTAIYNPCDNCTARVAVDGRGRIHTVFGSQSTSGKVLYYSRSDDGGRTWLPAVEFDRVDARFAEDYGPALGTVVTLGLDQVHVIWDGAPAGQRWHRWSTDGGQTWSQAQEISPDQRGLTLPVAAAFDSAGALHVVSMGWRDTPGTPRGAFHLVWQNGRWSEPQLIGSRTDWDVEYAALAISRGNVLVAAWTEKLDAKETLQIWTSNLKVDAPAVAASASPPAINPTPSPGMETRPTTVEVEASALPETPGEPRTEGVARSGDRPQPSTPPVTPLSAVGLGAHTAQAGWVPFLLGVLPPLILVVLILIVRANRQRRGG